VITLLEVFHTRLVKIHNTAHHLCSLGHTATAESLLSNHSEKQLFYERTFKDATILLHRAKKRSEYGVCKRTLYRLARAIARDIPQTLSDQDNNERQELYLRRTLWEKKIAARRIGDIVQSTIQAMQNPCPTFVSKHHAYVRQKKILSHTYALRTFHDISTAHIAFDSLLADGKQLELLASNILKPSR
jgi:hypothetical protein